MNETLKRLAGHLESQQQTIIERWSQASEADNVLEVKRLTHAEFRNNIPASIRSLCRFLVEDTSEALLDRIRNDVAKHGHQRWKQGFSLKQLIHDWGRLNQVLAVMLDEYFQANPPPHISDRSLATERLAEFMTEASSGSVTRYEELRRAEAESLSKDLNLLKQEFETWTKVRGQLLREAAHDIRGGLSAITSASDVLKHTGESKDSTSDILDVLDRGVGSISQMLNSLLDLSRLESGADSVELLTVDIAEVLRHLVTENHAVAMEKGLGLHVEGPQPLIVKTDPQKVRRIAQNLLVNALQHTRSGEIRLSWQVEADQWILRIADTGPGIQDKLGSPLAQELDDPDLESANHLSSPVLSRKGEGIGLTIVKRLCDMLDAGLTLDSELGKGSIFTIEFPLSYAD